MNLTNVSNHFSDLRLMIVNFIKRICTNAQLEQLKTQVAQSAANTMSSVNDNNNNHSNNSNNNNKAHKHSKDAIRSNTTESVDDESK